MGDCIFCRVVAGTIPAKMVAQDDRAAAFHDINPQAPTHILIIPKRHIASVAVATPEDEADLGHLFTLARQIAHDQGLDEAGYRLVVNTGAAAGQTVFHIHVHLLGGRVLTWPPG